MASAWIGRRSCGTAGRLATGSDPESAAGGSRGGGMDQLGPARAAQLIVVSQIAAAYLIELFGLFGVDKANFQWSKVLGLGLSIIGIMIVKWK